MKKILSALLVAAMLLSAIIVAAIPASAADGQWTTYGHLEEYDENYTGDPTSIPGYEYTEDGLHVIPADWTEQIVYGHVQTKAPEIIADGIYLEFKVDEFDGMNKDNWFAFSIWDGKNYEPGVTGGKGVCALVRVRNDDSNGNYFSTVEWYSDGGFASNGTSYPKDEDGKLVKTYLNEDGTFSMFLEITVVDGKYVTSVNGALAPEGVNTHLAEVFTEGEAYLGVTYRHGQTGGTVDMTITKFGTSKEDALIPDGSDSVDPVDNSEYHAKAEIADPSTVADGQPCLILTGNVTESATKKFFGEQGGVTSVGDDYSMHLVSPGNWTTFTAEVKNDISFDAADFPVMLVLTKNYCTCNFDQTDGECWACESIDGYFLTGENYAAGSNIFPEMNICYEPIIIEDGDMAGQYLYFTYDFGEHAEIYETDIFTGRINGIRLDFSGVMYQEAGRNAIDVAMIAFFRSYEDAEAYVFDYLGYEGGEDDEDDDPVVTDAKTEEKTEEKTEAKTEAKTEEKTEPKTEEPKTSGGCGGVIGAGAFAVVAAVAACGAIVLKKKED